MMGRKIENALYRITSSTGRYFVVECNTEKDLIDMVLDFELKGAIISNVVRLEIYAASVRTPKVAIASNKYYKQRRKELFKG